MIEGFDGVCSGVGPSRAARSPSGLARTGGARVVRLHPASPERAAPESSGCLAPPARPQILPVLSRRAGGASHGQPVANFPHFHSCAGPNLT